MTTSSTALVAADDTGNVLGHNDDETDMGASAMTVDQLEDMKQRSLAIFAVVEEHFNTLKTVVREEGYGSDSSTRSRIRSSAS